MRFARALSVSMIAAAALVGCKSSDGASASASASKRDATCKSGVSAFAAHFAPVVVKKSTSPKKAELQKAIEASIVTSCETDAWNEDVLTCFKTLPPEGGHMCLERLS